MSSIAVVPRETAIAPACMQKLCSFFLSSGFVTYPLAERGTPTAGRNRSALDLLIPFAGVLLETDRAMADGLVPIAS